MGYYSSFEAIEGFDQEKVQRLEVISGCTLEDEEFEDFYLTGYAKWYSWGNDLKRLSSEFPDTLFAIERTGEDTPDCERIYAKNGKTVSFKPEIVWPEFDESDLS